MYRIPFRTLLILTAASLASPGRAADPADPQTAVPPLHYRSNFQTPRGASPTAVGDWHAVNAAVGQQTGHVHGEASADDPQADHRSTSSAPDSGGHAGHGHGMHGRSMHDQDKQGMHDHGMHGHAMHDHAKMGHGTQGHDMHGHAMKEHGMHGNDQHGHAMPEHCMQKSGGTGEPGGQGGMHPDQPKEGGNAHRH